MTQFHPFLLRLQKGRRGDSRVIFSGSFRRRVPKSTPSDPYFHGPEPHIYILSSNRSPDSGTDVEGSLWSYVTATWVRPRPSRRRRYSGRVHCGNVDGYQSGFLVYIQKLVTAWGMVYINTDLFGLFFYLV